MTTFSLAEIMEGIWASGYNLNALRKFTVSTVLRPAKESGLNHRPINLSISFENLRNTNHSRSKAPKKVLLCPK